MEWARSGRVDFSNQRKKNGGGTFSGSGVGRPPAGHGSRDAFQKSSEAGSRSSVRESGGESVGSDESSGGDRVSDREREGVCLIMSSSAPVRGFAGNVRIATADNRGWSVLHLTSSHAMTAAAAAAAAEVVGTFDHGAAGYVEAAGLAGSGDG